MTDSPKQGLAVKKRLAALRAEMAAAKLDAYFIPSVDPHQSEYLPACWERRAFISGFSGSAGDVIVTTKQAGLWTDGRYFLQATRQLSGTTIKLFKQGQPKVPTTDAWLAANLEPGQVLGADPRVLSKAVAKKLAAAAEKAGAKLQLVDKNLVDAIWAEQPAIPQGAIAVHPARFAGESVAHKLKRLRKELVDGGADALVLTTLDAIAWTFNIRGTDVDHNPVAIAYGLVTKDSAQLFCHPAKVPENVRQALAKDADVLPYDDFGKALAVLNKGRVRVWIDPSTVNAWVLSKLKRCPLKEATSPIVPMKARKNAKEMDGARAAHVRDGVAMVRFLHWLSEAVPKGGLTEIDTSDKLAALRAEGENFRDQSFGPISGYAANGAIVHYSAEPETAATLRPEGLYLIDSGGQYLDGTTDITRTVLLGGKATAQQKEDFTRVLKGHIALSQMRFPAGTPGRHLDAFARRSLWEAGLDYAHGTGHGVGSYLGVHEGPQAISPTRCTGAPLEEGNILSNEPGYYREGQYGIRIENLVLVQKDAELSQRGHGDFLGFETLTLCPIDTRLVDTKLLSKDECAWLDAYHRRVKQTLGPLVPHAAKGWLAQATKAL